MNTAKKRILSLTLTICLALSMMLTLSACGKKEPGGVFQHRHHAEACHLFR